MTTADQRLTIILSALGLLFLVMSTGVGILVRLTVRWARIEDRLGVIADKIQDIVRDKDKDHDTLEHQISRVDSRLERHEEWHRDNPR
jgi:hypothetical protein